MSTPRHQPQEDIAIVGMACIVPGADTPGRLWQNIVNRANCITDPPPNWHATGTPDVLGRDAAVPYTTKGGFLGELCRFRPAAYGVMPVSVDGAEPDQFLALRCAAEALQDAGVPELPLNGRQTAVILGRGSYQNRGLLTWTMHGYVVDQVLGLLRQLQPDRGPEEWALLRNELKRRLPPFDAETVPGTAHCLLVGRIANRLNLQGPVYTIDAACASSLLAVEQGMRELRSGRCDAALVGGVQVSTPILLYQLFCQIEALSRTGKIAPFSAEANGTLLGEGCAMLVLKRRSDAERDGNRIYALLKAVGVSADGRGAGLLAPRTEGQQLAIRRAYEEAGISCATIELIEAHGTGMPLGDKTEVQSLKACFGPRAGTTPTVAVGSVKSMVGHSIPAAGATALIKTALALYHRTLPATLHSEEVNPELGLEQSPFYLSAETRPWVHGQRTSPRRAGVNAFGFGGINAHAILEEHPIADEAQLERLDSDWPVELVVVSAAHREQLRERVQALISWLRRSAQVRLLDIAASCAAEVGDCRLSIVAANVEELLKKLEHAAKLLAQPDRERIQDRSGIFWYQEPLARTGRLAFVFPGEGAQYPNMLADLCRHFPEVRREFDLLDTGFMRIGSRQPLSRLVYPPGGPSPAVEAELLELEGAVASVTAAQRALMRLLTGLGIQANAIVGHSSGEFGALQAAGAFAPADEESLIQSIADGAETLGRLATPGLLPPAVLTTVGGADRAAVEKALADSKGRLSAAMDNCPHQLVLAGDEEATATVLEALRGKGGLCERLPWGRPYHTDAFAPAIPLVETFYRSMRLGAPNIELWSCATAERYPSDPEAVHELAVRQWRSKVRFRETIQAMYEAGVRLFVEVGPRGNLSAFVSDTLAKQPHAAVPLDVMRRNGIEQLCRAVGMLAAHGLPVNLHELLRRRKPRTFNLHAEPPAPPAPEPILEQALPELKLSQTVIDALQQTEPRPRALQAETAQVGEPLSLTDHERNEVPSPSRERVVPSAPAANLRAKALAEYQRTMQVFLKTQQEVTLARFGVTRNPACGGPIARRATPGSAGNGIANGETEAGPDAIRSARLPAAMPESPERAVRPAPEQPPPAPLVSRLPFLETVLVHDPELRLVVECELDVARHPFLQDHAFFGRRLSVNDPTLIGLPIMPLAMTLELMAEAAVRLRPGLGIAAVRDIRTLRWLAFETPTRRVRIDATVQDSGDVRAVVYEADREAMSAAIAEARFELSSQAPQLGPPIVPDNAVTPFRWPQTDVYERFCFHGPAFQGIVRMEACDRQATRATVQEPDPGLLLAGDRGRDLVLPVALIDVAGHVASMVVGYDWNEDEEIICFPNTIERLEFVQQPHRPRSLRAVAQVQVTASHVRSDVEMLAADGAVVLRALGRSEEMVRLPADLYRYWSSPRRATLTRTVGNSFADVPGIEHCTLCEVGNLGGKTLVNRLWSQVLARMILSARERQTFRDLKLPPVPTASWLLGRVVAKDAVRLQKALDVCMADVEIFADKHGRPLARLVSGGEPLVSFAHKGFAAVAAAADANAFAGLGIDIEPLTPLDPGVRADAFTAEEHILIESVAKQSGESVDHWYLSVWGAKEAVGKALGRGVVGSPQNIEALALDRGTGRMSLTLRGTMASLFPSWTGQPLHSYRRIRGQHVLVLCLLPRRN